MSVLAASSTFRYELHTLETNKKCDHAVLIRFFRVNFLFIEMCRLSLIDPFVAVFRKSLASQLFAHRKFMSSFNDYVGAPHWDNFLKSHYLRWVNNQMKEEEINGSEYKYEFYFHIRFRSVTERTIEETILEGRRCHYPVHLRRR